MKQYEKCGYVYDFITKSSKKPKQNCKKNAKGPTTRSKKHKKNTSSDKFKHFIQFANASHFTQNFSNETKTTVSCIEYKDTIVL